MHMEHEDPHLHLHVSCNDNADRRLTSAKVLGRYGMHEAEVRLALQNALWQLRCEKRCSKPCFE
jgi:hypothetical protein